MPWIKTGLRALIPSLTWQPRPRVAAEVARQGPGAVILDLGAGGRRLGARVIGVDFLVLPGTRVAADVTRLPFADACADLIVATGLLEHVADPRAVLGEMRRVLRPGGNLHVEIPFLQPYHADPRDFRRYTLEGLQDLVREHGFQVQDSGVHIGPTVTLLTVSVYYFSLWFEGGGLAGRVASNGLFWLLSLLLYPFKFLDYALIHKKNAHRLAFGLFCTAVRGPDGKT
ncbi:MAG: class I SAM-dependent methyltransferase [Magnetococcales bacterium]|nr:class I SAM-dependent methyltransferase [Magnetococcales bacterium]